jgi:hypothetical protein
MRAKDKKEIEKMISEKCKERSQASLRKLIEGRLIREEKEKDEAIMKREQNIELYGSRMVYSWKRQGIINDNWKEVVFNYYNATRCEECNDKFINKDDKKYELIKGKYRVLDHDHDTGEIRNVICHTCNVRRGARDKKIKMKKNSKKERS